MSDATNLIINGWMPQYSAPEGKPVRTVVISGTVISNERVLVRRGTVWRSTDGSFCADRPTHWQNLPSQGWDDADLVGRAVRACVNVDRPLWAVVADRFAVGSSVARALCRRFGLDPDELREQE